ncbi:MAG: hypothetical protein K5872_06605 [Rhizobiaceae bacterium]|nr:hypothetical protein [Rhizobiaceae bacterium]MCV0405883.1 hypothetical protein [Rhizobiaceae bacterium]
MNLAPFLQQLFNPNPMSGPDGQAPSGHVAGYPGGHVATSIDQDRHRAQRGLLSPTRGLLDPSQWEQWGQHQVGGGSPHSPSGGQITARYSGEAAQRSEGLEGMGGGSARRSHSSGYSSPASGGGLLGGIRDLLSGGQQSGQNEAVAWLQRIGYRPDQATFIARDRNLLQQVVRQQALSRAEPSEALKHEKLWYEVQEKRNPTTDDIREYQFARKQGYRGSFPDFMREMRQAGATNVNVGAGEKAWDQESAKLFARRYDDLTAGASNAEQMLGMYDIAEQAINSGVRTGFGAEMELNLRQLGAAMGLDTDPEKLAGGELIRSIQNRMALTMRSPDGGMGMPGALSDRDIKFLKDSQIGIDRSPEGNRRMLQAFRAMEQRKIEIARLADQYIEQNGRLDTGFNRAVRDYAEANPLFPEEPVSGGRGNRVGNDGPSRVNTPRGPGQSGRIRAVNPQTGERIEWNGSAWEPVQ